MNRLPPRKSKKNIARIRRTQNKLEKAFLKVSKEYVNTTFKKFASLALSAIRDKDFKKISNLYLDFSGFAPLLYYYLIKCREGGRSSGITEALEIKNYYERRKKKLEKTANLLDDNFFNYLFVSLSKEDELWAKSFAVVPVKALEFYKDYSLFLSGVVEEDLLKQSKQVIISSLENGLSLDDTMLSLGKVFSDFDSNRLENIARTEMSKAYNGGRMDAFKSDDMKDLIVAVEFTAILDSRTSEICAERDGQIFKIDSPELAANTPPLHFMCRSTLIPVDKYSLILEPGLEEKYKDADNTKGLPPPLPGFGGTPKSKSSGKPRVKKEYIYKDKSDKEIYGTEEFNFSFLEAFPEYITILTNF